MQPTIFYYLVELQYLGFRYHGWQKQPDVKTLEQMFRKTLGFVLPDQRVKALAMGRTDAMVSVNQTFIELFVYDQTLPEDFLSLLNVNLPSDMRAISIQETDAKFNIIKHPKEKEYLYFFTFPEKVHPFCAPFMISIHEDLDLEKMKLGARFFEGKHDFYSYCFRPNPETITTGEIRCCEIVENDVYSANFFPPKSYMLRVIGKGFKRHQIRLMMGALIDLGKGKIDLDYLKKTINGNNRIKLEHIAQASGLMLHQVHFTTPNN
ncbi:MAG: tRNA pseudouridine(38-40) synthase TruA [Bacteroidota bacterium]